MSQLKSEEYWSKFAGNYDDGVDFIVGNAIQQRIIKRLFEEHNLGEVIEFGCGTGYFTRVIAKSAKYVIATDLSDEMIEVAKLNLHKIQNITIQKSDCENVSFPSGKFDPVFMANVIHYIKEPIKALQESHRILKSRGLILLIDYTGFSMKWSEKMKLGFRFITKCGIPPRYFKTNLSPDELNSLPEAAGFKIENIQLIGENSKALYLKGRKK